METLISWDEWKVFRSLEVWPWRALWHSSSSCLLLLAMRWVIQLPMYSCHDILHHSKEHRQGTYWNPLKCKPNQPLLCVSWSSQVAYNRDRCWLAHMRDHMLMDSTISYSVVSLGIIINLLFPLVVGVHAEGSAVYVCRGQHSLLIHTSMADLRTHSSLTREHHLGWENIFLVARLDWYHIKSRFELLEIRVMVGEIDLVCHILKLDFKLIRCNLLHLRHRFYKCVLRNLTLWRSFGHFVNLWFKNAICY